MSEQDWGKDDDFVAVAVDVVGCFDYHDGIGLDLWIEVVLVFVVFVEAVAVAEKEKMWSSYCCCCW